MSRARAAFRRWLGGLTSSQFAVLVTVACGLAFIAAFFAMIFTIMRLPGWLTLSLVLLLVGSGLVGIAECLRRIRSRLDRQ